MVIAEDGPVIPASLTRNIGSLSEAEQKRLLRARIGVCGCGGLGGQVVENLARAGVGALTLFDPDRFETSNLNRQLGALPHTLGQHKARVLAERAEAIHGAVHAEARNQDFRDCCSFGPFDLVLDCLDGDIARRDLSRLCARMSIPLVHGAVHQWYGQLAVQLGTTPRIDRLYPEQSSVSNPPSVLAPTVAMVAALQAAEAIKLLLDRPSRMRDHVLILDLTGPDCELIPW